MYFKKVSRRPIQMCKGNRIMSEQRLKHSHRDRIFIMTCKSTVHLSVLGCTVLECENHTLVHLSRQLTRERATTGNSMIIRILTKDTNTYCCKKNKKNNSNEMCSNMTSGLDTVLTSLTLNVCTSGHVLTKRKLHDLGRTASAYLRVGQDT